MFRNLWLKNERLFVLVLFILVGFARDLLFPEASLLSRLGIWGGILTIVLFFGSLGLLACVLSTKVKPRVSEKSRNKESLSDEELLQRDAINSVGLMAAGMVHNFRNYLEVMEATAGMLEKLSGEYRGVRRAVTIQKKCLLQARNTVDHIMWFIKREEREDSAQRPLNDILEDAVQLAELLVKESGIQILRDFESVTHKVKVNDISLMQAVINLIKNAAEASEPNSQIIVSTRFVVHEHTYEFCVAIRDFGSGMHQELREELFIPFTSYKQNGTGLGLYTVKQLVEDEGGSVEVNSEEGQGTEVLLRYPLVH